MSNKYSVNQRSMCKKSKHSTKVSRNEKHKVIKKISKSKRYMKKEIIKQELTFI